jgi:hypothetical protein
MNVAVTTFSIELPAASTIAWMFFRHCRVCSRTEGPANFPVLGSCPL